MYEVSPCLPKRMYDVVDEADLQESKKGFMSKKTNKKNLKEGLKGKYIMYSKAHEIQIKIFC